MNIIDSLKWRYAVKKFDTNKKVSEVKLNILLSAFNLTATSYGLQPVKLVVLSDTEKQNMLVEHSMEQEQIAQASHILILCVDTTINTSYIKSYFNLVKSVRHTPDAILDPFKNFLIEDFENRSHEEKMAWAKNQAYLIMGNLLTVCAVEGIDACPMEGFIPEKYDELLDLKTKGLQSVLVLPIGYRAEDDFMAELKKVRKELKDSVIVL
ncbi:NAD(P)H-dependent oxidoreductase [Lacinutrix chionoecetis]